MPTRLAQAHASFDRAADRCYRSQPFLSANLTRCGLTVSIEMGVLTDDVESIREFVTAFGLDNQLISRYEANRGDQFKSSAEDDPIPPPVVPNGLSGFSDFVLGLGSGVMPRHQL